MKKFLSLGLIIALTVLSTVGCGSGSSNTSSKSPTATTATTATTAAPATAVPQKAVTLKYMTWDYSDRKKSTDAFIKDVKDKFNITIDMQNVPTDQYQTLLKTRFAANDIPDLINVHKIDKNLIMEKFEIQPDQLIDVSTLKSVADYSPVVLDNIKANKAGKLYYVPVATNVLGVMYNKKVFSDNGIAGPTTIDEFYAANEKLKTAKIVPMAAGFKDAWAAQIIPFIGFGQYINTKNPKINVQLANGTKKYADLKDDLKKVLSLQSDWATKGYLSNDFLGTDINVASQMVGTGKAAMLICGTWQYKTIQNADPNAQIGFFALPLNAKGEKTVVPSSANGGIVINAKSANVEAAKQVLDFYLSAENQTRVIEDLNGIPTHSKVEVSSPFVKEVKAAMKAGDVQGDWWDPTYYPAGSTFQIAKEFQNLLAKGTTIEQFISDFDAANAKALVK